MLWRFAKNQSSLLGQFSTHSGNRDHKLPYIEKFDMGIKIEWIAVMRAFGGRGIFHKDENDFLNVYESRGAAVTWFIREEPVSWSFE